ncbi:MAG: DUF1772 domain-containing protein [Alphaproteobacteria bacterium]|nr:DUF1772 domain-containing protein [Alphaproteobacteria bacterium]
MRHLHKPLELVALLFGAITFGTAYYLLFLSHPAWMAVPFEHFIPVFREMILSIGASQIIVSNIALAACVILFFWSKDWFWLLAVVCLLLSLPVTMWQLMPINFHFLEAAEPALSQGAADKLSEWGNYQIIRFIGDGFAFASMCKPVLWRKKSKDQ